ncbi:hypothetical protein SUGI_0581820 [Cryptomeria japonica]|uniref:uncharacterized protein LOC131048021 n=1 Tax=Cryptomeria japonica TaxID=3369 RepID=UPI002414B755|nr:uncharacterized protein LOC131048021 [Cryptomeria japonica]GLJ29514.1 hypothetical protein SUGI_0581820 [Cryptomeria japonica]
MKSSGSALLSQLTSRENRLLDSSAAGYGYNKMFDEDATCEGNLQRWKCEENGVRLRKRVVILVDESREARLALLWALSHVVNNSDIVTLLYIVDCHKTLLSTHLKDKFCCSGKAYERNLEAKGFDLVNSLESLSKARRPEVQTEVVVVGGDKAPTIVNQVNKLEASVLVIGQRRPSLFQRMFHTRSDALVEYCIANTECLTLGVRKQSNKIGGYLINSRWQKNFWLLA